MRRILVISNGHGEIAIAERIAATILRVGAVFDGAAAGAGTGAPLTATGEPYALDHLPLVGVARDRPGFAAVGPRAAMPSGGLVAMGNVRALAGDVAAGFAGLFSRQVAMVRRARYDGVVAVGDVYALAFALLVRAAPRGRYAARLAVAAPAIFVGTAKSVTVAPYGPGERRLLARARRTFVRDVATAEALRAAGIAAEAPGNVIVDMIDPAGAAPAAAEVAAGLAGPWVAVFPGSRERAYEDVVRLLAVLRAAGRAGLRLPGAPANGPLEALCSIAPGLAADRLTAAVRAAGWSVASGPAERPFVASADGVRVTGWTGPLGTVLARATIALGQAGTANEQAAAAGVPVVALGGPRVERGGGEGWYRMRQQRLLGEALALVPSEPQAAAAALRALLADGERLGRMAAAGRQRMGGPGGAAAIARAVHDELLGPSS